jgi:hypothetical protein
MAYPTFTYNPSQSSAEALIDDIQIDRASNGKPKARALYTAPKKEFTVVHEALTSAERATLLAYYAANRLSSFDFVWAADGVSYTCLFGGAPRSQIAPGLRWTVTTHLVQA